MDWSFGDVLLSMLSLFFLIMLVWMFVSVFGDIFRRNDLSGGAKALWIALLFLLPLIGILAYVISRPPMTEQDRKIAAAGLDQQFRREGYSPADEIAKLAELRAGGQITDGEYEQLKAKALQ